MSTVGCWCCDNLQQDYTGQPLVLHCICMDGCSSEGQQPHQMRPARLSLYTCACNQRHRVGMGHTSQGPGWAVPAEVPDGRYQQRSWMGCTGRGPGWAGPAEVPDGPYQQRSQMGRASRGPRNAACGSPYQIPVLSSLFPLCYRYQSPLLRPSLSLPLPSLLANDPTMPCPQ